MRRIRLMRRKKLEDDEDGKALNERSFGSLKTSGRLGMAREDEDN
ncbi:10538_t:CDS:2, partial [Paraglomus brasilianum]